MRVLIINSMFFNAHYRRCADELGKLDDIELTVLTIDKWVMNLREYQHDRLEVESPYHFVVGKGGWHGKENRGFYRTGLIKAFRLSRPEVIYLMEEPFSLFTIEILTLRAIFAPDIPVVFFTWNNLSLDYFDYRPSLWYRTIAKWSLMRMQYAVTANNDAIGVLRAGGFYGPAKVLGYAVDTKIFRNVSQEGVKMLREQLQIPSEAIVFGYIGRMIWMKGLDLLLESFATISNTTDVPVLLLLLGSGKQEVEILARAHELGISSSIRHIPTVSQADVPPYMALMDIFVLPSRRVGMWSEQFGRVLVEAMASRTLLIGSSSGAIPEVIGDAGFVFKENDSEDLLRVMKKVLSLTNDEKEDILCLGEERAANVYSWKHFAEQSAEVIRQVHNKMLA